MYPVVELMDICYGYRFGWLSGLLGVVDAVMLRPEKGLGVAFGWGVSIKRYLAMVCGVPVGVLNGLGFMMDHGIFVDRGEFKKIFGIDKTPKALIDVYGVLGVDYGLALDVPSRLHVEIAMHMTVSRLLGQAPSNRIMKAMHPSIRPYVEKLATAIQPHIDVGKQPQAGRKIHKLVRQVLGRERHLSDLHDALYALSEASVKETMKNLEEQLRYKATSNASFKLVPVIQGLYEEHARECLSNTVDLLISYGELLADKTLYIAIGTGGRVLTNTEARMINGLMRFGHAYARMLGTSIKYHLLGWSSPKLAEKLELSLVYSSDSLSARRRAVDGKIYVMEGNKIRLTNVSKIDPKSWNCPCPACQDKTLRTYILDPSSKRRNDARIVHNLWIIKQYILRTLNRTSTLDYYIEKQGRTRTIEAPTTRMGGCFGQQCEGIVF